MNLRDRSVSQVFARKGGPVLSAMKPERRKQTVCPAPAADLEQNLTDLHARVHQGAHRATPSRRTYIPKADGRRRPLAVAALEDNIVQRATVAVLNCIYEEEFLGFSYGFRPKRGQHDALDALAVGITDKKVNFILDADVRSFFDEVRTQVIRQTVLCESLLGISSIPFNRRACAAGAC